MVLDVTNVDIPYVEFAPHSTYPEIHNSFNSTYAMSCLFWHGLFTVPDVNNPDWSQAEVIDDVENVFINDLVMYMIRPAAIHTYADNDTAIATIIKSKLVQCIVKVGYDNGRLRKTLRLDKAGLESVLRSGIGHGIKHYTITININHLFFNPVGHFDVTDFGDDMMRITHFPSAPNPTLGTPGVGGGGAGGGAPPSGNDPAVLAKIIGKEISDAFTRNKQATTPSNRSPMTNFAGPSAGFIVNHMLFPAEIRTRYEAKMENRPIAGHVVNTCYNFDVSAGATDDYYYCPDVSHHGLTGKEYFIGADGTLFLLRSVNFQNLLKIPAAKLTNVSAAGVRRWYNTLHKNLTNFGIYVHPLWAFRTNAVHEWGFDVPNNVHDINTGKDIPIVLKDELPAMSGAISQHLSKDGTFPRGSEFTHLLEQAAGDGYSFLRAVVQLCHPMFQENPGAFLTGLPRQQDETIVEFKALFDDYLYLQASVLGTVLTFNQQNTQDMFIATLNHASYLMRRTRQDRSTYPNKFTSAKIASTLTQYMKSPDSPTMEKIKEDYGTRAFAEKQLVSATKSNNGNSSTKKPFFGNKSSTGKLIQPVSTELIQVASDTPAYGVSFENDTNQDPDMTLDKMVQSVDEIPVQESVEGQYIQNLYVFAVKKIAESPSSAFTGTCVVCSGPNNKHSFDQCPILANTEFLRKHYIRFCQIARRDHANLSETGSDGNQQSVSVNYVGKRESYTSHKTPAEYNFVEGDARDFQRAGLF